MYQSFIRRGHELKSRWGSSFYLQSIVFFTVFCVIAGLRLWQLDRVPLSKSIDEIDTGYQITSLLATHRDYFGNQWPLAFQSFPEKRAALPIYLATGLSLLPGISIDQSIRLTIALASIWGLVGMYLLANRLFEKHAPWAGLVSMGLLGITPWHFTFSRVGFEVPMYFSLFVWGIYLYLLFTAHSKIRYLLGAAIAFSLTPFTYNTAKLTVAILPVLLVILTPLSLFWRFWKSFIVSGFIILLPLGILLMSGGAASRFQELSIFTDPTISSQINYERQSSLGPGAAVGSTPRLVDRVVLNKFTRVGGLFWKNILTPVSLNYLAIDGDPNPRHAVQGFGMMLSAVAILSLLGLGIVNRQQGRLRLFLLVLIVMSILPSALTRDGATHAIRLFLLNLPLNLAATATIMWLWQKQRLMVLAVSAIILFQSLEYFHTYFTRYPYDSERQWYVGMKEVMEQLPETSTPLVIDPSYEPPILFYAYYHHVPPAEFQEYVRSKTHLRDLAKDMRLEGHQFGERQVYFAAPTDTRDFPIAPAEYFLTSPKFDQFTHVATPEATITYPTGGNLFYYFHVRPTPTMAVGR